MTELRLGDVSVGEKYPVYFVADIAANHDGDIERAKHLIRLAAESGAQAAKFQHFRASEIVSDRGFHDIGPAMSHQALWKKPVVEVYRQAEVPWEWTGDLKAECETVGIEFFSAAYDFDAVDMLDPLVRVFKIGSGDITWPEMLEHVARKGKPVLLATGASDIADVQRAMDTLSKEGADVVVMQCNTNYTGSLENFAHLHLNVLRTYGMMYPGAVLGLSDHSPGYTAVLGAISLGAKVIEKHFTDDSSRRGPDHGFSLDPPAWREMVSRTRELEAAFGSEKKFVAANEQETVVIQRRCLRAAAELPTGTILTRAHLHVLRPAPVGAIPPFEINRVVGKRLGRSLAEGEEISWLDLT
jgi:sialic acid synthase SpsE